MYKYLRREFVGIKENKQHRLCPELTRGNLIRGIIANNWSQELFVTHARIMVFFKLPDNKQTNK